MRPVYETEEDIANQESVAQAVAEAWQRTAVRLPKFDPGDYALLNENRVIRARLEIKCRSHHLSEYPTLHLSAAKAEQLVTRYQISSIPVFVVVRFKDNALYYIPLTVKTLTLCEQVSGGRTDRGDDKDIEPVIEIPVVWLRPISTVPVKLLRYKDDVIQRTTEIGQRQSMVQEALTLFGGEVVGTT